MARRLKKQLIYAASFAVLLAIVIGGFYWRYLRPTPTCFDGIQNQGEQGIDCGGPCTKVCLPSNLMPLARVDRILVLRPDASHISLLTQVSNPNFSYAVRSFSYSFELLDASGTVTQEFTGDSFIYAGEVKYILVPNVPASPFVDVEFKTSGEDWISARDLPGPPNFNTAGAQTNILPDKVSIDGTITNMEAMPFSRVTVIAVLRGKLGQVAGASETEVDNLQPQSPQQFSIIHPPLTDVDPLGTKIYAYASWW